MDGNDSFINSTALPSVIDGGEAHVLTGGGGNDIIVGGNGQDTIYGNQGNDTLIGSAGSDTMSGGGGNDLVKGESGIDLINGDEGDDRPARRPRQRFDLRRPGPGPDRHRRQRDTIAGGSQTDNFGVDAIDVVIDAAADEQSLGYLHEVEAFFAAARPEAACRHPSARSSTAPIYPTRFHASHTDLSLQNFAAFPLFAAGGPTKDDFFQGSVGDQHSWRHCRRAPTRIPTSCAGWWPTRRRDRLSASSRRKAPACMRVDADLWIASNGN